RRRILSEKLLAVLILISVLNLLCFGVSLASIALMGEPLPFREMALLHLAYYLLQLELAGLCFGLSAFLRRGSLGAGMGIAIFMYGLHLLSNLSASAKFLKYITPFAFCDGAGIMEQGRLEADLLAVGLGLGALGIVAAYGKYEGKDIQ
ncbi:MAG: ABC transporter permease, partial [Lachnospiraceae bacterium]|nr:ABC transporter permease [Lachnospiraceae bacterium]